MFLVWVWITRLFGFGNVGKLNMDSRSRWQWCNDYVQVWKRMSHTGNYSGKLWDCATVHILGFLLHESYCSTFSFRTLTRGHLLLLYKQHAYMCTYLFLTTMPAFLCFFFFWQEDLDPANNEQVKQVLAEKVSFVSKSVALSSIIPLSDWRTDIWWKNERIIPVPVLHTFFFFLRIARCTYRTRFDHVYRPGKIGPIPWGASLCSI